MGELPALLALGLTRHARGGGCTSKTTTLAVRRASHGKARVAAGAFRVAIPFKAIAISLPVLLLILDVYPLRRLDRGRGLGAWWDAGARKAWFEKVPYALLGRAVAAITLSSKPISQPPATSDWRRSYIPSGSTW